MKEEYDFSKGVRGKFYRLDAEMNLPVYLEPEIGDVVRKRARMMKASIKAPTPKPRRGDRF